MLKHFTIAILLLISAIALAELAVDEQIINAVNKNPKATWKAGANEIFKGKTLGHVRGFFGVFLMDQPLSGNFLSVADTSAFPEQFNAKDAWPECSSIALIRDQGNCGSCYAVSAADALTDRFCISQRGKFSELLSSQDIVSCDKSNFGCQGGYLNTVWKYMETAGIPTESCYPYVSGKSGVVPPCVKTCGNSTQVAERYHAKRGSSRPIRSVDEAMKEISTKGPIQTGFRVYKDFLSYKSGVYKHLEGGFLGGHAVRVVGWGSENGQPYWIAANSWGTKWGDNNGYFWIARGKDECQFESNMYAGDADAQ
jgi:cathepsin B